MSTFFRAWLMAGLTLTALAGCATIQENLVFWSRSDEIEASQARAQAVGVDVQEDAYRESLKRWPYLSPAGLQRRALLYSLLVEQQKSLDVWSSLSPDEDPSLELAEIASVRAAHSAF